MNRDAVDNYIDGRWVGGEGELLSSTCPASGDKVWEGGSASRQQVEAACAAARKAAATWMRTPLAERVDIARRYKAALSRQAEEFAVAISKEVGKPLWEARTEVTSMVNKVDISIAAHEARTGAREDALADGSAVLTHRPHGVLAVLGPYNFPGHLPNGHIVPALIAGNAVVFKPSEYAPGVAVAMARSWAEAGLPAGVLNIVHGFRETGEALVGNDNVDGVLMTGSYSTGVALSRRFAGRPEKLLALEMGGNNPLVVWDVDHIDAAVIAIIQSAFVSAGQRCTCARRLIVPNGIEGVRIVERLLSTLRRIRVGAWDADPEPFMGPVISARIARGLLDVQDSLVQLGARALQPMRLLKPGTGLLSPGVLDVTGVPGVPDEEVFGPLLTVCRVADFDEAIAMANRTTYGLAAALLSDSESLWNEFWTRVRAGVVNWNRPTTGASSSAPFGGTGRSGNHRPSAYYAADYCAYPVAAMTSARLVFPKAPIPGLSIHV
jgi:succinylglutamic semialdehyde dehydrogenase